MATWLRHIDRFDQKYDKAFAKDPLIEEELIDRIHKSVKMFLHYFKTTSIKNLGSRALAEFGGLQKKV